MNWFTKALSGSIGQKLIMAITGLFLITFLIEHLLGNLLLLNPDSTPFNEFVEFMSNNTFIKVMEYVLFAGFIVHIVYAAIITAKNKKARPINYHYSKPSQNSSWFSRNMGLSGSMVLIFLIVHLSDFFIPYKLMGNSEMTMYDAAMIKFSNPIYVVIYAGAMVLLAFHLNHGFQSAFQTLGLGNKKYTPIVKGAGAGFSIIVPALYALIPIYIYLFR
jgi:succinate dehydrogenase / fumarate reductase cytochrome b subunit